MRYLTLFLFVFTVATFGSAQKQSPTPLSSRQACAQFSGAVVRIDAGGQSRGTGFIVSPDGYVLTAGHVLMSPEGAYFSAIAVTLPSGRTEFAKPAVPLSADTFGHDFAILKIDLKDAKEKLPFLTLGDANEVNVGDDATIIGFPFSALDAAGKGVSTKFCLSAQLAAKGSQTVAVQGTNNTPKGPVPFSKDVEVDVIYFQGPSVKGISGSPIIERNNGHVVGIVSWKLTGIGQELMNLKDETARGLGSGLSISGLDPGKAVNGILTVLDNQLANDLGAANAIDAAQQALNAAQRNAQKLHSPPIIFSPRKL